MAISPKNKKYAKRLDMADVLGDVALVKFINDLEDRIDSLEEELKKKSGPKGDTGKNGKDGKDGKDGNQGPAGPVGPRGAQGPEGPAGKDGLNGKNGQDGSPDSPAKIVAKINSLKVAPELQIDAKHIKNLPKSVYVSGSAGGGRIVKAYDLSSQLNGTLKTFNLPAVWRVISVHSSSAPFTFRETTDYTWTQTTLAFTSQVNAGSTLKTGQTLTVIYSEA